MNRKIKDLFETDWENELQEGDTVTRKEDGDQLEVVLLAGLQRLARQAGITRQSCIIQTPAPTMVQAVYSATFILPGEDGESVTFVGAADCNAKNTNPKFAIYPTAIAESRAEARCLRKALGIKMLSSEEIGFRDGIGSLEASPTGRAASSLIAAIENLCTSRNIDAAAALTGALAEGRAGAIFELSELTTEEAQSVMAWLNEQKPATKSKRSARKAELQAKQGTNNES